MIFSRCKSKNKKRSSKNLTFANHPNLQKIKPREGYHFRSDYFRIDSSGRVGTVLSFFHMQGAADRYPTFWGVDTFPSDLPEGVTVLRFEQIVRMSDAWAEGRQTRSERNVGTESKGVRSNKKVVKMRKAARDLEVVATEMVNGAAYLLVTFRLLIKAPNLETLDLTVSKLSNQYLTRFTTLNIGSFFGEQHRELSTLLLPISKKAGKAYGFTSTEFAGAYSLMTRGLSDLGGEFVGTLKGDVSISAIMFNVNKFCGHVVVASQHQASTISIGNIKGERGSGMWGSKLSQACLVSNGRVVHLVLDGTNLDRLGPKMGHSTTKVNLNTGLLNMFEMFGNHEDELQLFAVNMNKLGLMAEHTYSPNENDRSIIRGSFEEIVTQFYIDSRMWAENAPSNRHHLRAVGIPHEQVPKLDMFLGYLNQAYRKLVAMKNKDDAKLRALSILRVAFGSLLRNNGDLFNVTTSDVVDQALASRRAIYDLTGLDKRGPGIMMAQLLNVIGLVTDSLSKGDLLVIHGVCKLSDSVKEYVAQQITGLKERDGRVAYLYNRFDKMLSDHHFSNFERADYHILGGLTSGMIRDYQTFTGMKMPQALQDSIMTKDPTVYYIRRDFDNVVFYSDPDLGIKKEGR